MAAGGVSAAEAGAEAVLVAAADGVPAAGGPQAAVAMVVAGEEVREALS